jgi:hypothetical protein
MNARLCLWILLAFLTQPLAAEVELDSRIPPGGGAGFRLQSLLFNGSGCPMGQGTSHQIQGDILWLKFPAELTAESSPGSSASERRKNCIATLRFATSLQSYAIESYAFAGFADLSEEGAARLNINWFYEGQGKTESKTETLEGPYDDEWYSHFSQAIHPADLVWKPCGLDRALNINSSVLVSEASKGHALAQFRVLGVRFKRKNCFGPGF